MVAGVVVGTGTGDDATDDGTVAVVAETTGLVVTVALAIVESLDAAMVLDVASSEVTEEVLVKIVVDPIHALFVPPIAASVGNAFTFTTTTSVEEQLFVVPVTV